MKKYTTSYDVLNVFNEETADIIQSFIGKDCLGLYNEDGLYKLYFNEGLKNQIEFYLNKIKFSIPVKWEWKKQSKEDWHLNWMDNFKPIVIDKQLAIIPHWEQNYSEKNIIKIKPGMAFGTGHHESTWMILSQIINYVKPNMSVLDLGTGSGILSIASIKYGANKIDAIEIDLDCKENFYENLTINKINNKIKFHNLDVLEWDDFNYDIIIANINRNVIEKLIPRLSYNNGLILLSGLLKSDFKHISSLCLNHNINIEKKIIKGEWLCLVLK